MLCGCTNTKEPNHGFGQPIAGKIDYQIGGANVLSAKNLTVIIIAIGQREI